MIRRTTRPKQRPDQPIAEPIAGRGMAWILAAVLPIALLGLSAMAAGCGGSSSQFEVKGEERTKVGLAGDWKGSYVGIDSGRKGEISFRIVVGRHTADGEVLMFPAGFDAAGGADAAADAAASAGARKPQPLQVSFAEVADDGTVKGTMEPYTDPQCACQVTTEFNGVLEGDRIEGTFSTQAVDEALKDKIDQKGRWWVERQAP